MDVWNLSAYVCQNLTEESGCGTTFIFEVERHVVWTCLMKTTEYMYYTDDR